MPLYLMIVLLEHFDAPFVFEKWSWLHFICAIDTYSYIVDADTICFLAC